MITSGGEDLKNKKRGWEDGAGAGVLKGGGGGLALFLFNFFIVFSFLHLEVTLPFAKLCYVFEEK